MFIKNVSASKQRLRKLLTEEPEGKKGNLLPVIKEMMKRRKRILLTAKKYRTPFYLLDDVQLQGAIQNFSESFRRYLPDCNPYYAVKANHHPHILKTVAEHGYGLDVSSGRELQLALDQKAKHILFSGPGKTREELALAVRHRDRVTINIDSFSELAKLGSLTTQKKKTVRAGVRIYSKAHGSWSKFGIPLSELKRFWLEAKKYRHIDLQGIHFHLSWNRDATKYVQVLSELGTYLGREFNPDMLRSIRFVDFGGGFYPDRTEGFYPWTAHSPGMLPTGAIIRLANAYFGAETKFSDQYYLSTSETLDHFARDIAKAIKEHIRPLLPHCVYYTEPGRIICTKAMHIVLRVADAKSPEAVITDGGVNIAGWEYGEHFYYPLLNLTHPSQKEIPCTLYGSLCTPHDIWGYHCYAKNLMEGDVILVPNQGAYRYSLAQNFIKPIPETYILRK